MHFGQVSVAAPHRRSQTPPSNQLWLSLITKVRNTKRSNVRIFQKIDKALLEAASSIIKLGERENLTLDQAAGCVARSKPTHKRRKKGLASRRIEHQRKQSTQGQLVLLGFNEHSKFDWNTIGGPLVKIEQVVRISSDSSGNAMRINSILR
jgi:hypothetical protein